MATSRQMFWTGLLTGLAVGMAERMEAEIEMAPMEHDVYQPHFFIETPGGGRLKVSVTEDVR